MPEDLGERFYIHAALNCTSGKGMPEGMKTFMRDIRLFQKQLEAALIGADGNGLPVCGHHEGRIAPFFQRFEDGQQLFLEKAVREAAVFGSSMTSPPLPSKRATLPSSSPQATTSSAKTTTSSSPAPSKTSTASNTELSSQRTFRNHRSTRWFRFFHIWQRTPLSSPSRNTPRRKTPAPPCYHFYMRRHSAAAFRKLHLLFVFRNALKTPLLTMGDFCPMHNIIITINVSSRN